MLFETRGGHSLLLMIHGILPSQKHFNSNLMSLSGRAGVMVLKFGGCCTAAAATAAVAAAAATAATAVNLPLTTDIHLRH